VTDDSGRPRAIRFDARTTPARDPVKFSIARGRILEVQG
jgi:hypothetical protein